MEQLSREMDNLSSGLGSRRDIKEAGQVDRAQPFIAITCLTAPASTTMMLLAPIAKHPVFPKVDNV
jgi:hypothetical protein